MLKLNGDILFIKIKNNKKKITKSKLNNNKIKNKNNPN